MDNLFQTLSKLIIETFIRKILNKYLKAISHPNIYIYIYIYIYILYNNLIMSMLQNTNQKVKSRYVK